MNNIFPIDLGYGWTKAKYKGKNFKEPSIIGVPRLLHDQNIKETDLMYGAINKELDIEVFNPDYFIGNLAVRHSIVRYHTIYDNRADSWNTRVLLESAIGDLTDTNDEDLYIITGLPLDYYFNQKMNMEYLLSKYIQPKTFALKYGDLRSKSCTFKIKEFKIVPQPLGAAMNYLLDENGEVLTDRRNPGILVVADIGFHTFDLLVLDIDTMEILSQSKTDPDISISNSYTIIQNYLNSELGRYVDNYKLDMYILNGNYQGFDLTHLLQKALESLANQIQFQIEGLNVNYRTLILTGGWASLIAPMLKIGLDNIIVMGQDGNISGYEKIAQRLLNKSTVNRR